MLRVLYLIFNEGYARSTGDGVYRGELSAEAIRLARMMHALLPADREVAGLLALMLLTDARRPARTGPHGELVPLSTQRRDLWNREQISEGVRIITAALRADAVGEYQAQAAIAAIHDDAQDAAETDWPQILYWYGELERLTGNPMVTLNRAVALAMVEGPAAGLELLRVRGRAAAGALPARRRTRAPARDGRRRIPGAGAFSGCCRAHDEHRRAAVFADPGRAPGHGGTTPEPSAPA